MKRLALIIAALFFWSNISDAAINVTAVWRLRPGGNDANGAGYDSAIASAGTDYSQQDAPQLSVTDGTSTASTTITSVTGGFTAAMIGNALYVTGTGVTAGYYFITAVTNTNTITVDRASGTYTAGVVKVGGAAATYKKLLDNSRAAGDCVVGGNTVYMRGSGNLNPSTTDYADVTGFITPVVGSASVGKTKLIGENGRPYFRSNGLLFYSTNYFVAQSLKASATSNSNGQYGIFNLGGNCDVISCIINTNNQSGLAALNIIANSLVRDSEITSGQTSPSYSANAYGIASASYSTLITHNYIHGMRDFAIALTGSFGPTIDRNLIVQGATDAINDALDGTATNGVVIRNNTIDGNAGNGITITQSLGLIEKRIYNNIISNHTGVGKYGLSISAGTTAANDRYKQFVDYNDFFNNTANYNNISAGANDQTLDPQFVNSSGGNYAIGTNLQSLGYFSGFTNSSTNNYMDIGAAQHQGTGAAAVTRSFTFVQ